MHRYINLPVSEISLNSLFFFDGGTSLVRQRQLLESHTHANRYLQGAYLGSMRCAARLGTFYYFGRTEGFPPHVPRNTLEGERGWLECDEKSKRKDKKRQGSVWLLLAIARAVQRLTLRFSVRILFPHTYSYPSNPRFTPSHSLPLCALLACVCFYCFFGCVCLCIHQYQHAPPLSRARSPALE